MRITTNTDPAFRHVTYARQASLSEAEDLRQRTAAVDPRRAVAMADVAELVERRGEEECRRVMARHMAS